ncbi:MAG: threonine--tRNA ligase [Nanoarchaeota archaeon]|nr:threonine--tRNA ligase [Nanoarchaeota archaeon]
MKILTIHADFIEFEAKKKALKKVEEAKKGKQKVEECLVVLTAFEKKDEKNLKGTEDKYIKEIKDIVKQVNTKKIVLYPYAHLSSNLGNPKKAEEFLKSAEKILSKDYQVTKAPFGYYKSFQLSCKGHPLSELSREFSAEDIEEKETEGIDEKFALSNKKLSQEEKVNLSTAFAIAKAVKELFPKAEIGISDFYHDSVFVDISGVKLKINDFSKIKKKVKFLLNQNLLFEKSQKEKLEPLQREIFNDLSKDAVAYNLGDLSIVPLYKNPFIDSTKGIKAFQLNNLASAYWRNNSKNKQLERIYCIGFSSEEELNNYLQKQEEAKKRDHRELGKQLKLFSIHEEAPGMPFFHNKGTFIFDKLVEFMTEEMKKLNYEINKTPTILNKKLWLQSGHWEHYKENMYFTKIDDKDFAVKPMNCPGNILIFKNEPHSYRELPIKAGEFGLVHRHELSGVLSGLFRMRSFTQDDAHIFCTEKQLERQIIELLELVEKVYSTFGFKYHVELSTKPEKAMGNPKTWSLAEKALANALKLKNIKYKLNPGDGAFYGPKIDFHIKDALGRSWQCGTIQLDFQMPEKFDLTYEGNDGKKHRPVMLHRAIYGSIERFMGILIEHFAGKFPLWLNPVQIKVITVTNRCVPIAKRVIDELKKNNLRVELDDRTETMGKKVREAQLEKVNYIITIGDKEVENKKLAVRKRSGKVAFGVDINKFISDTLSKIKDKEID